ncbi:MAG: peptidoglycan D,D-transpeptidase FtsI family protein [Rickettsiales bacterium]
MEQAKIPYGRLKLLFFIIILVFLFIIFRLIYIVSSKDANNIKNFYESKHNLKRADIFDRNGVLLATDLKTKSLYVSSVLVRDPKLVAKAISTSFEDLSYDDILRKITDGKHSKHWILIRRNLTPSQVEMVEKLQIAGLIFEDDLIRVYPQKNIASHYVGYVDLDRKGLSGIEMQYDRHLMMNKNLTLAMDVRIQDILFDELTKAKEEFRAKSASGIVMNVNNGEILGLVSLPSFDANIQSEALPEQRFNMVTNGSYELGSVMKIFTNAMAFEHNLIDLNDIFYVGEPIKYGKFSIKDHDRHKPQMNVKEIFAESSNIGTIKIAEKVGIYNQKEFLGKFGFLKKVEADFPGLGRIMAPTKNWSEISLYTISYGHGIASTPLHLALATSAIVNGGYLYKPSFLKLEEQPRLPNKLIKDETVEKMKILMRNVVEEGTGKYANIKGYEVGGKTGTADRAEMGGYNEGQTLASFVGVFPIFEPKYLVYVVFDRPNYTFNTAGMVAAPVAGRVIKNIAPLLSIKAKSEEENKKTNSEKN